MMVAKKMVVYHRRAGGQSQFSALLEGDHIERRVYATEFRHGAPHHVPVGRQVRKGEMDYGSTGVAGQDALPATVGNESADRRSQPFQR